MSHSLDRLDDGLRLIGSAAFDSALWPKVLTTVASLTGSAASQIIGWQDSEIPSMLVNNMDLALLPLWLELGGAETANPIVRGGAALSVRGMVAEHEFLSTDFMRCSQLWQDFYETNGLQHIVSGKLWSGAGGQVIMTTIRDRRGGLFEGEDRERFARLLEAAANAAEVSNLLGEDRARLLAGAFDAVAAAVVIVDGFGQVMAVSPAAEGLLRGDQDLRIVARRVQLSDIAATRRLDRAIGRVTSERAEPDGGPPIAVRVPGKRDFRLRVLRAPHAGYALPIDVGAFLVIERDLASARLSPTEHTIMTALVRGDSLASIAQSRGVSLETVRTQSKAIYAKLGVSGQIELMSHIRDAPGAAEFRSEGGA